MPRTGLAFVVNSFALIFPSPFVNRCVQQWVALDLSAGPFACPAEPTCHPDFMPVTAGVGRIVPLDAMRHIL